jgi:hypothetical protein
MPAAVSSFLCEKLQYFAGQGALSRFVVSKDHLGPLRNDAFPSLSGSTIQTDVVEFAFLCLALSPIISTGLAAARWQ